MKRFQLLFSKILPYLACFLAIFALMYFGSRNSVTTDGTPIAAAFDEEGFKITADQISESYTIANIANTIVMPSTSSINENYMTVSTLYEEAGVVDSASSTIIEKPSIIDTSAYDREYIKTHTVQAGETLDSIIKLYGSKASKNQIRWSNGLKNETLTPNNTIYVPTIAGIVYKTKKGNTIESLAKDYSSNAELIIAYNDLEGEEELKEGTILLLPNGILPEKERPEYVAPKPVVRPTTPSKPTYTYTYVRDSGIRHGMIEIGNYSYWRNMYNSTKWQNNPGAFGNCTWFAWYWRRNNMGSNYWLPTGAIGNASAWVRNLSGRYSVGRTPSYGAIMQSNSGYYGHVAVVVGVNPGKNITIQEMNYAGPNGKFNHVYQSTINWNDALKYNYIYGKK